MAKQTINVGGSANDGTGDKIRVAFQKINANFTELYDGQDPANLISTDPDNAIELGTDGKLWSGGGSGGSVPDATTTVKGKIKLAGDLAGTADLPTVPELANKQNISEKNASNGYVGLSGFQIAFKNHLNTITNYFANYNTIGSRTYTFPDKSMTVAGTDDIPTVDATPTDGSSNAVSSNGVFDGLALKQNTLTETNFGSFINGLTAKNTLVDADEVVSDDSADSNKAKKTSWLNVWDNYLKPKVNGLISSATSNTVNKLIIATPSANINSTSQTIVYSQLIPANTLPSSCVLDIDYRLVKTGSCWFVVQRYSY